MCQNVYSDILVIGQLEFLKIKFISYISWGLRMFPVLSHLIMYEPIPINLHKDQELHFCFLVIQCIRIPPYTFVFLQFNALEFLLLKGSSWK